MIVCSVKSLSITQGNLVKVFASLGKRPSSSRHHLIPVGGAATNNMERAVYITYATVAAGDRIVNLLPPRQAPLPPRNYYLTSLRLMYRKLLGHWPIHFQWMLLSKLKLS